MKKKQKLIDIIARKSNQIRIGYVLFQQRKTRYLIPSIFSVILLFYWPLAQANYEIYFNNTTENTVDFTSFLKLNTQDTSCSRLDPQYYRTYSGIAQAYQKVQLFDINYNKGLPKGKLFCFQSNFTIHPKNTSSSTISTTTKILGDGVASEIQSASLTIGAKNYSLFATKPYPKPVALTGLNNLHIGDRLDYSFYAAAIHYFFTTQSINEIDYVLSLPQTRFTRNDNEAQLTVGTYNVQLWPKYAGLNMRMNQAYLRAQLIPLTISQYDVVVLEELRASHYAHEKFRPSCPRN